MFVPSAYSQDHHAHRSKAHTAMLEKGWLGSAGESVGAAYSEVVPINVAMH
jgi:hypothetical protein